MEELFERLRTFQELLMERVAIEKEVRELPKSIAAQEEVLTRARKSYGDRSVRLEETQSRVGQLRAELADVVAHKDKSEQQMDSITNPREFEALNKEITEAGLKEDQLRKDLKREEENLREAEVEVKASETLISSQEAEIAEKRERITNEAASMSAKIEELKTNEAETTSDIDPEVVFKFERIIKSKQGVGIVPVKGVVCSGCSMILPAQFVNEVRQSDKIVFCPYCSRVLFYQDGGESQEDMIVDIESGSLADLDDFGDESDEEYDDDSDDDSGKDSMSDSDD
ncbi:MAG TPA: zinc ribbon domain-containing protein [Spirochaetia bacterium]|nr:zinc ribbon domain-containing protein [Spirochaetaceae bacterium]HPE87896.1 zinc ribbon domain-containing protein [Spirochaetales bacterium]HRW23309.1 zinc ribbon domain-containing protein [Spirochaetia bacterium]